MHHDSLQYGGIKGVFHLAVIVAALGYFVDVYDLILFSIVRVESLKDLGLFGHELVSQGLFLLNMQMLGMLIGGVIWGVIGDKKGRLTILFGSIILYSTANFLNGFVQNVEQYAILRFLSGIGLAGELGGGVTLVSEMMTKNSRGYATMLIATFGVIGGVSAGFIAEHFDWRTSYIIGGILGFILLLLRLKVKESKIFEHTHENAHIVKGNFLALFTHKKLFKKYIFLIGIGLPTWFVAGILITLSPEFAKHFGIVGTVSVAKAVMAFYLGLIPGDFMSGLLSQILKSRKKALGLFFTLSLLSVISYFFLSPQSTLNDFYLVCFFLGVGVGYWAVFVTVAAEQFGTNLRATVTTTIPNFARGATVPITMAFLGLKESLGLSGAAIFVGMTCFCLSWIALVMMEETFHRELDFHEKI